MFKLWLNLTSPRGVASVTASSEMGWFHLVINVGKAAMRKALPNNAGLNIFIPRPPKSCLARPMAMKEPRTHAQIGNEGGIIIAKRIPVTTALQSEMAIFLFIKYWIAASKPTQDAIDTRSKITALVLKKYTLAKMAGIRAIMISLIICDDDSFEKI